MLLLLLSHDCAGPGVGAHKKLGCVCVLCGGVGVEGVVPRVRGFALCRVHGGAGGTEAGGVGGLCVCAHVCVCACVCEHAKL